MECNKKVLQLRPHHLICMQGFQGYGYNKVFTEHLKNIIDCIKNNQFESIEIVKGCDDICSKCPNKINSACNTSEKVDRMDKLIINKLGIDYEFKINLGNDDIFQKVNSYIKNNKDSTEICSECCWIDVCLWFKAAQKKDSK